VRRVTAEKHFVHWYYHEMENFIKRIFFIFFPQLRVIFVNGFKASCVPTLIHQGEWSHKHDRSHRTFFSSSARRTQRFFYFPIGKSAPTVLFGAILPSLLSEDRNSRLRKFSFTRWALESPRPDMSVNADFLSPYRDFGSIATSLLAMPSSQISNSRLTMCRNADTHVRVDFSDYPLSRRDFGLRWIANPNTKYSGLLATRSR
jgi:hypothetical protein